MSPARRRAFILGGGGMLARELGPALERAGWSVDLALRMRCDVTDPAAVAKVVYPGAADVVVDCAAYTQVDSAENEPERCFATNATGTRHVAEAAADARIPLVYLSTDYVFDGKLRRPYREDDAVAPLGVYARSKEAGERAVREVAASAGLDAWIVRTGELYGAGGPNFFDAILGRARKGLALRVVNDQVVTPTWTRELAAQLAILLDARPTPGVYHATARGEVSWYDAAREALGLAGFHGPLIPVSTPEWGLPTPRPPYSVLAHDALDRLGLYRMRPWRDALADWLLHG